MGKPLVAKFINGIAVMCCSSLSHEDIIKRIIGEGAASNSFPVTSSVVGYPWNIETKYYTAGVNFYALQTKDLISSDFADSIEAVLIHFDNEKIDSFKDVQNWLPFVQQFSPHVQLLACNNCSQDASSSGLTKSEILSWCLQHKFELVELNPDEDSDEEDDFKETNGYKRIIQALHAHTWSELCLKEPPVYKPSSEILNSLREPEACDASSENLSKHFEESLQVNSDCIQNESSQNVCTNSQEIPPPSADLGSSVPPEDQLLLEIMGEDPGTESFEELFSQLKSMKEKAETLSGDERKKYAAKVAIEFWRASGGDEDEIAGLSSDDD